jgi:hypothetical protein
MNVFAFSTPPTAEWRWRLVDEHGATLDESSARFPTMQEALAAGTEQLRVRRNRDRPSRSLLPSIRRTGEE